MSGRRSILAGLLCVLASARADATTIAPMSADDLAQSAAGVVIGEVRQLEGVLTPGGIVTLVQIEVEEVLQGAIDAPVITLKEEGGTVGATTTVVFGAPQYSLGERVLVFLGVGPDGALRTSHMALGKFHLDRDASGEVSASQQFGEGTRMLPAARVKQSPSTLAEIRSAVRRSAAAAPPEPPPAYTVEPAEARDPWLEREFTASFALLNPTSRHFEADEGDSVAFFIDDRGDATIGLDAARRAANAAFAVWEDVATASLLLNDGGLTNDLTTGPGHYKVRFDDPSGQIDGPVNCSGLLGIGGYTSTMQDTKEFGGTSYQRIVGAYVTLANGFAGCSFWNECNVAEVITHELGHALGLGHSSEVTNEANAVLRDATMFYLLHLDGRCASVRQDDIAGISSLYPSTLPMTIITANPLPAGFVGVPYEQAFEIRRGTPPFAWSLVGGGFPGLSFGDTGSISGTPTAFGTGFFRVQARDADGNKHTRNFNLMVSLPPATTTATPHPSPTVTRTAEPTPTTTPSRTTTGTVTRTRTPVPLAGDADCDLDIDAADVLAAARLIFDPNAVAECSTADCTGDGKVTAADVPCIVRHLGLDDA